MNFPDWFRIFFFFFFVTLHPPQIGPACWMSAQGLGSVLYEKLHSSDLLKQFSTCYLLAVRLMELEWIGVDRAQKTEETGVNENIQEMVI